MNSRKLLSSVALVGLLGMAACSDKKDAPISKEAFVTQANALCSELNAHLDPIAAAVSSDEEGIAFLADEFVPGLRNTTSQIRALGFPKGDEALLEGLLNDTEALLTSIAADPVTFAQATESPFADINAQLVTYGLTVCGGDN